MQISIFCNDGSEVTRRSVKRVVVEEIPEMLNGKALVYDGDQSLFTLGPLPQDILEFSGPKR